MNEFPSVDSNQEHKAGSPIIDDILQKGATQSGNYAVALMRRSFESHGIDMKDLRVGTRLYTELCNLGIKFTLVINDKAEFEVTESNDARMPIGEIWTSLGEFGFTSDTPERRATGYIRKITIIT